MQSPCIFIYNNLHVFLKRIFVSIRFLLLFLLEHAYGKRLPTPMESFNFFDAVDAE